MERLGLFDVHMASLAWFDPDAVALEWGLGPEGSPVYGVLFQQAFALRMGL